MCGIAGVIDIRLAGQSERLAALGQKMAHALAHRGPDAHGVWTDPAAGLALGHRRLSILDLSAAGAQPMISADERWAISFNGEIYNANRIAAAAELACCNWRGHSDTEIILESFARRGVDATLADMNGMFAVALWDRRQKVLYLMRDHLGIKPLYILEDEGRLAFASELKAFAELDRWSPQVDMASATSFFRFGCVPAPFSIFKSVRKLMPGELMTITPGRRPSVRRYWSIADVARSGTRDLLDISDAEAVDRFDGLLSDAVSQQMISDVPIGVFLSGGIDSSTVTAYMVQAGRGPVRTFSVGSPDLKFDESAQAATIARHLGTTHTELTVSARDALDTVGSLPDMYDEPFADSSQIPTFLISKLTRQHVTVALSGDGGDEILAGYNRHVFSDGLWKHLSAVPVQLRTVLAFLLRVVPDQAYLVAQNLIPVRRRPAHLLEKLHKLAYTIPVESRDLYMRLISLCFEPARITGVAEQDVDLAEGAEERLGSLLGATQLRDTMLYLPDDILQKVDRASMAVALEVRPPLLDHRIVEFCWRLPNRFKIRNGESKWLLRRVLEKYVPRPMFDRPKMGFSIPIADWLRGPLREWSADLLSPAKFGGGLLDANEATRLHQCFLADRGVSAHAIWTLLMFESWRRRWT
ncbi:MAG TPA: asparagine synthase (glutamine-hydrolyzing) [Pseudolabrys sp.]|nr:asparagine synthase (glutamine-hydrolyzing) [Pseudolabrys sp.]